MMQNPPPDLIPRAKQILLPLVATADDREVILLDAFYNSEPRLYYGIDRTGVDDIFASRCITKLIEHGLLSENEHSLARLLFIARYKCSSDQHTEVDELVRIANSLCPSPPPANRATPIPVSTGSPPHVQTIGTPRNERRPAVFISYHHGEADFANRLIADLSVANHPCWIDVTALKGGDEWIMSIAEGIMNSYAMVVIVTQRALDSRWVQDEILWARNKNKPIIPLMLENVFNEKRFFPLNSYQAIPLFDGNYEAALTKLLNALPQPQIQTAPVAGSTSLPVHGDRRKRELAYLERLRLEELLNTEKYTPMAGTVQQNRAEMRAVFELLPMTGKDHFRQHEPKKFEDAVAEIRRIRRAVLLGEPGGGKTTTIWKLAAELVAQAIDDRKAPIPILVRLGRWTEPDQLLPDFITSQLGDLGDSLEQLLAEKRASLLLDGLNELPVGQRDIKYPQLRQFIERHPNLLAVVSCRELDYTDDLGFDRINITPLDPIRIREFAGRYLGNEKGDELFWRLAGDAARDTLDRFMSEFGSKLAEPERVFWVNHQLPEGVNWGYNWRRDEKVNTYWQDWIKLRERPSSLMVLARNPYMLLMLTSVFAERGKLPENRGELFRLFVETLLGRERIPDDQQPLLTEGLAKVAFEMQVRRASDETVDALTVLPVSTVQSILDDRMLYLARSAGILSVGDQARFTHQLLQEYFAAKYMDLEFRAGRLNASEIWPRDRWWQRTNWEEAAILLAGLYSDDCSPVVEWLADANPEIAAMCAKRSGAVWAGANSEMLRSKWVPRLTDLNREPEPAARSAIGRALGMTDLDNRKGVGTILDRSGGALPDIDWVEIPGGEFKYGNEEEENNPPQILRLPAFRISRYPITNAQFQTFLDDPDGYADPKWLKGLAAGEDGWQMREQYFKFSNHPRENVNWYQAIAFCRWLSWRLGSVYDLKKVEEWAVRLPTEFEWEKAARGTDGRSYPYKGDFDSTKSNTYETDIDQTTAAGIFPNGASPYGVMDMSGNVWEWCLSNYEKPAIDPGKENLRNEKNRVLRGGSWGDFPDFARAVARLSSHPANRLDFIGFRVVGLVSSPFS